MTDVNWDYTERARFYDTRADYAESFLIKLFKTMELGRNNRVADIGAGTGKLTKVLDRFGLAVDAVEPNDAMRRFGEKNVDKPTVIWRKGTGERTGLPDRSVVAAFFGSSFNVVDQPAALREVSRILMPRGWFCCMWNHRDLDDPLQSKIEHAIRDRLPAYSYGLRREDPTKVIDDTQLFGTVSSATQRFVVDMPRDDVIQAWKSHETLARQAGPLFADIIKAIDLLIPAAATIPVPYTTRTWTARLR